MPPHTPLRHCLNGLPYCLKVRRRRILLAELRNYKAEVLTHLFLKGDIRNRVLAALLEREPVLALSTYGLGHGHRHEYQWCESRTPVAQVLPFECPKRQLQQVAACLF